MCAALKIWTKSPLFRMILTVPLLTAGLAACQTTGQFDISDTSGETQTTTNVNGTTETTISKPFYSPFYSLDDHLRELIQEDQRPDLANLLFIENQEYFLSQGSVQLLKYLAATLRSEPLQELEKAVAPLRILTNVGPVDGWENITESLKRAKLAIDAFPLDGILSIKRYHPPELTAYKKLLNSKIELLRSQALIAFTKYNHFQYSSFFDAYPIDLDMKTFLNQNVGALKPVIKNAHQAEILRFLQHYPPSMLGKSGRNLIARAVFENNIHAAADNSQSSVLNRLIASQAVTALGLQLPNDLKLRIGIAEATSRALIDDGQIDFPVGVELNLPANITKISIDEALPQIQDDTYDAILVLNVFLAKSSRRVVNLKNVESTVFLGFSNFDSTNGSVVPSTNETSWSSITDHFDIPVTVGTTDGNTSSLTILEGNKALGPPVFTSYKYQKAKIEARKVMSVEFNLIFPAENRMLQSTVDVSETQHFEVTYGVRAQDPKRKQIIGEFDTERDVDNFEDSPSDVALSSIFNHARNKQRDMVTLQDAATLRLQILAKKNKVLKEYNATDFDARPLNDPRFDSVVAVYRGDGGLGSGFFVKSNVVLTNWHVVEELKYVEMRLYDGRETYGHVLGVDARLDLALIKVQTRGRPVAFYNGKILNPGSAVDAIGHPHRKLYSVTRGIVSAIRKEYSINLPRGAGKKVLYVQTDAPINPGNSGGPLFLKNKVVAVNTWGYSPLIAEGINFSIHYSEILSFLNEHLPGFNTPLY